MDRLDAMSILSVAVEAGSLSAAAHRLGIPLATVSRKVSALEGHLKMRVLNRSSRQLTLTDAGRSYVEACRRILEDVEEAERTARGEYGAAKGELVVTAPAAFGRLHVLPVAAEFLKAYPEIDLRLVFSNRVLNLLDDHVDLGVRLGELPDSGLVAMRVASIRGVVCASPAYLAARGTPQAPQDLAGHDCITFISRGQQADAWDFPAGKVQVAAPVRSRLVVDAAEAAVDAAIAGVGITRVYCYQVAEAVRAGALTILLRPFESAPLPVSLVHTEGRLLPLKLRAFLDFAAPRLRARVADGIA